MELIKRDAAIKRIKEYALNAYGIDLDDSLQFSGSSLPENYCEGLYEAMELINDVPTIDAAPVVHGRWRIKRGNYITGGGNPLWECSRCGHVCGASLLPPKYHFCPNCGARMDGGEGHG